MLEFLGHVTQNWPTVGLVATLLVGVYLLARYWATAEMRDMRTRIDYLDERVEAMLYRDQCYFAFVLADQEWHHRNELLALKHGFKTEPHISFMDFRDEWMKARGLDKELEIWKSA